VAGGAALDEALRNGETVEYRTGMVVPDPARDNTMKSILEGWDVWVLASGANTTGFPVGNGRVRIKNTFVVVTADSNKCNEYLAAATDLIDNQKVRLLLVLLITPDALFAQTECVIFFSICLF
jgi:hypothetical protein